MTIEKNCIDYLIKESKDKKLSFETTHAWRGDGLHILQHSLRVKAIAESIIIAEDIQLNEVDEKALPIAILLHDIGVLEGKNNHASKSVDKIQDFLTSLISDPHIIKRVNDLIISHSKKKETTKDDVLNILIDADALDEVGMQSIMMCSNWLDKTSVIYFKDFEERLRTKESHFIQKVGDILHFDTSKKILKEKLKFVDQVICQLNYENQGSLSENQYNSMIGNALKVGSSE